MKNESFVTTETLMAKLSRAHRRPVNTTLALEGEDGPLASLELRSVGSDHPSRLRTRCCTSRRPGACAPWQPVKAAPASPLARMGARCLRAHARTYLMCGRGVCRRPVRRVRAL